jgi:DNA-binding SARP family transcriptional activator
VVDLQVLGSLRLTMRATPVPMGPRQRVLLLCLWLARGEVVPSFRLASMVWDDQRPDDPGMTLRSHVHHLRRAMNTVAGGRTASSVLVTERVGSAFGYALRIPHDMADADRFERLAEEGRQALAESRPARAAASLHSALALWRGQPLADVADRPFAEPEIRRLEGLHRAVQTARLEASVRLGRYREATGELEALLVHWPGDEGLRRLLVTCLCRAGRSADAARVCRAGIELALDEGLDVSCLQALQREVLRGLPH